RGPPPRRAPARRRRRWPAGGERTRPPSPSRALGVERATRAQRHHQRQQAELHGDDLPQAEQRSEVAHGVEDRRADGDDAGQHQHRGRGDRPPRADIADAGDDPRYVFVNATWDQVLPMLPDKSVDSVFALDFIEHLEKRTASACCARRGAWPACRWWSTHRTDFSRSSTSPERPTGGDWTAARGRRIAPAGARTT